MRSPSPHTYRYFGLLPETWVLIKPFFWITALATCLGILSGLATAGLLATVNDGLHGGASPSPELLVRFGGLCVLSILGSAVAGVANSVAGQRMIANMRKKIAATISKTDLEVVEQYRPHRLLTIISGDVDTVSTFTFSFPGYAIALAIIIGSFCYLAYLSFAVFLIFAVAVIFAVVVTAYSKVGWARDYEGVRSAQDRLQEQYRAITEGAKELRLNKDRLAQVQDINLSGAVDKIADLKIGAMRRFWMTSSAGNGIVFLAIGILLGLQGELGLTSRIASGAVLVMLYIRGPVEQLLNGLPAFFQAQIAFRRISELSVTLRNSTEDVAESAVEALVAAPHKKIELRGGRYAFRSGDGLKTFELGPLDLEISTGEILFVVGENGSGKTTLIKVLLGLYSLEEGDLLVDGVELNEKSRESYRQLFSGVFTDYFLFSELLHCDEDALSRADSYLAELEIAHKVNIHEEKFSNIDLSTGQRKRLALIHAYLEHRPIMMFDEWAADQDPTFRRVFYERILPDLKAQGKTLIVVSHDDRFFYAADRVVTLKDGKIVDHSNIGKPIAQRTETFLS